MAKPNKYFGLTYVLSLLLACGLYYFFAYELERQDFNQLFAAYSLLFLAYFYWNTQYKYLRTWHWLLPAILFRLISLFSFPELSDDYFRFIWDGSLFSEGQNPYLILPSTHAISSEFYQELFNGLNSPNYYTIYPPASQWIFLFCSKLAGGNILHSIIGMRLILILGDVLAIYCLLRLKKTAIKSFPAAAMLYALNPLIIIEMGGNLHFEGIMIALLLLAIVLLKEKKTIAAGIPFALSIGIKLIPLMFLPFLIKRLGWKAFILFSAGLLGSLALISFPFISKALFTNFYSSIELYFQNFEFNASFYYLFRKIGFGITGYNEIGVIGKMLWVFVFLFIVTLAFNERRIAWSTFWGRALLAFTVYLLFATTVHPWYASSLLVLGLLAGYRFPMVFSYLIFLSYSAYQTSAYTENLFLVSLEYGLLFLFIFLEMQYLKSKDPKPASTLEL